MSILLNILCRVFIFLLYGWVLLFLIRSLESNDFNLFDSGCNILLMDFLSGGL